MKIHSEIKPNLIRFVKENRNIAFSICTEVRYSVSLIW
jgi:hypothetical protein